MGLRDLSIRRKLILLQLLVVLIVLVLHSAFHFLYASRVNRDTISTKLESMANILAYNCAPALNFRDPQDAARTLRSLEAETQVTHAWILDDSGRVFAAYTKPGQKPGNPADAMADGEEVRGRSLTLTRRILQDGEGVGAVVLLYDLGEYREILLYNYLLAGLAFLGGMGIAMVLASFTHRALSDPILHLVNVIGRVSRTKDLTVRILEPRRDEIGILYEGFNDMMAQIHMLNETLERRVEERTRELEMANERLLALDQMKSMFLASMSHELRTPLNSIIGFTGLLLLRMSGDLNEEQVRQLTMIKESSTHLLGLINDVLDISKIESGRVDLSIESFSVAELMGETLASVKPLAEAKGLELAADVPEGLTLRSDRRRVKQVLMNLLSNAIKFSDRGAVRAEVAAKGDGLVFRISDRGIGIRPEDIEKLFAPFGQLDISSTKKHEGTGLGLYLCKKILALLRGTISAESEYGVGTTFTIVLPVRWEAVPDEESAGH